MSISVVDCPDDLAPDTCPFCGEPLQLTEEGRCGHCQEVVVEEVDEELEKPLWSMPEMRYQNEYAWFVLVAALDLILTFLVVYSWGGYEVNPVASVIISTLGFGWAIVFKFTTVMLVVVICEAIGRRDDRSGRMVAIGAIVISAIPVAYTFVLLFLAGPPGSAG